MRQHSSSNKVTHSIYVCLVHIISLLQRVKTTARKNLQLVGVAAMFLASKYEELFPPEINEFVYITDNTYTKDQILHMEKHIFKVIIHSRKRLTSSIGL